MVFIERHLKLSRLQILQSVEARREAEARNLDPSIGFALDWLAKNGDKLEQQVHRPPMISVNVPRREVAWQIEMCTSLVHRKVKHDSLSSLRFC